MSKPKQCQWHYLISLERAESSAHQTIDSPRRWELCPRRQQGSRQQQTFPLGQSDICLPFHLHSQCASVAFHFLCFGNSVWSISLSLCLICWWHSVLSPPPINLEASEGMCHTSFCSQNAGEVLGRCSGNAC